LESEDRWNALKARKYLLKPPHDAPPLGGQKCVVALGTGFQFECGNSINAFGVALDAAWREEAKEVVSRW
jgi:hypothetical protein